MLTGCSCSTDAAYLDVNMAVDPGLLWIAEEAFFAPLPEHYVTHRDGHGDLYYFNTATNESSYCHPMDNLFRKIAQQFGSPVLVEEAPPTPTHRPQARGASEATGRMYAAMLPGGVTRDNLISVRNGEIPGQKALPPDRTGGGYIIDAAS